MISPRDHTGHISSCGRPELEYDTLRWLAGLASARVKSRLRKPPRTELHGSGKHRPPRADVLSRVLSDLRRTTEQIQRSLG